MKKTLLFLSVALGFVACRNKPAETPEPEPAADTVKTVTDTMAKDTVVPELPKLPMYESDTFTYDTAYYVDPNNQQHKFVKYKVSLVMPKSKEDDRLVKNIRYDIVNFASGNEMSNYVVAARGCFAKVATQFKTDFRAANEFSKNHYFEWIVARYTKVAYQDSRLYCVAKGLFENKGNSPVFGLTYSNWDKKTKERIEYKNLFAEKDAEDIRNVLVECIMRKYGVADEASLEAKGVSAEQIAPSNKFLLTKDTIFFTYSPYELGVDAERSIKIPVATQQLRPYMDTTKSIVRYLLEN